MKNNAYHNKLLVMQDWCYDNIDTVEEFCIMFDITLEDMVKCFPDALVGNYSKVHHNENDTEEEDDEASWEDRGFHIISEKGDKAY